jgi:methylase of polypeptide subunit release factors
MNQKDATEFILFENKNPLPQLWLDLGCGTGLFTLALAGNLPAGSKIIAIDKDEKAFKEDTCNSKRCRDSNNGR